jgi:hypothetical protein
MGPGHVMVKKLTGQARMFRNNKYLRVYAGDLEGYLAYSEGPGFFSH